MAEREPMTQNMTINDVQRDFRPIMKRVSQQETRVLVEDDGAPVAAIVSTLDLKRLTQMDKQRAKRWKVFDEIHARNADKDPDEVERDVAEAIEEMREERRKQGHVTGQESARS